MADAVTKEAPFDPGLYERDEHEWIAAQIDALSEGHWDRLDRAHLIEYLTDMTIRDRRELASRLTVLLVHLLKLRFQPERLTKSWVDTIRVQQEEVKSIVEGIPSLGRRAEEIAASVYPNAVKRAATQTGLPRTAFPPASPWTVEEAIAMDPPDPPHRGGRH